MAVENAPGDRGRLAVSRTARSMEAMERVAAFLDQGGTTISDVLARIGASIGPEPNDTLFAVGSVAEGLGTPTSDLDLVLITDRDVETVPRTDAVVAGRRVVDVLVLQRVTVAALRQRLRSWSAQPWELSMPAEFDLAERVQLHRLTTGVRLVGPPLDSDPSDGLALAKLKLHVARHTARTVQVDLAGYRSMADYVSMC